MGIRKEDIEWAVMNRLRYLLERTQARESDYPVTLSLSLVLSIIAWGRQRVGANHEWPKSLGEALLAPVTGPPWSIPFDCLEGAVQAYPNGKKKKDGNVLLQDASAWEFFIFLRDSVAHGDHRNIFPMSESHGTDGSRTRLVGFEIHSNRKHITGVARMREDVLVRFGTTAATRFCAAYGLSTCEQENVQKGVLEREDAAA